MYANNKLKITTTKNTVMSFKPLTEKIRIFSILGRIRIQNRTRIRIHHPGSGSGDPDPDPDPHQNDTDPKHCFKPNVNKYEESTKKIKN